MNHKLIHLLVDGDISYHKACRRVHEDGTPVTFAEAIAYIQDHYEWLRNHLQSDKMTICLSPPSGANFRKKLFPTYKGDRPTERPPLLDEVKDWLVANYEVDLRDELEADDTLGILSTEPQNEETRIIVSIDKDLEQIPGKLFNPMRAERGVIDVSVSQGDIKFYTQWLTGDSTDCYPGVPGIGPKKAEKLIQQVLDNPVEGLPWRKQLEEAIFETYEKYSLPREFALTQAHLARILRYENYDELGIMLWQPQP